jgi:hypothetical protein
MHSLTSALERGERSASRLSCINPSTYWIRGWVGSRAVLDAVVKRKISYHFRSPNSKPSHYID